MFLFFFQHSTFIVLLYSPCLNCHSYLIWYVVFLSGSESAGFLSFVYACIAVGDPVILCTCPTPGHGIPMSYVRVCEYLKFSVRHRSDRMQISASPTKKLVVLQFVKLLTTKDD